MAGVEKQTFEEHLNELHHYYGPDMADLPTADNILDRVAYPNSDITYDQCNQLIDGCLQALLAYFSKYGQEYLNIVTLEKMDNFLGWVETLPVEFQITTLHAIQVTYSLPSETKQGRQPSKLKTLTETVGQFLKN